MAAETPSLLPHEQPLPPRKDLWIAAVFFVLGVAISWLAFRMPTYADQKGEGPQDIRAEIHAIQSNTTRRR